MHYNKSLTFKQVWNVAFTGLSAELGPILSDLLPIGILIGTLQFIFTHLPLSLIQENLPALSEKTLFAFNLYEALWGLAVSILYSLIVPHAYYKVSGRMTGITLKAFLQRHTKLLTIETLRTLPIIFIYLVLLIIPGFVKIIRLLLVPYVVLFHRSYQRGEVDALKKSAELSYGSFWGLTSFYLFTQAGLLILIMLLPELILSLIGVSQHEITGYLIYYIFLVPVSFVAEVMCAVGLLKVFVQLLVLKEGSHELAIWMERN